MARKRALKQGAEPAWAPSPADLAPGTSAESDLFASIAALLQQGQAGPAAQALVPVLDRRAKAGDRECGLAAATLRLACAPAESAPAVAGKPEDALSATLDRLVELVRRQDEQIRTLQDLLEATL